MDGGRSKWSGSRARCRHCSPSCRVAVSRSASWQHTRQRSRTCSSRSPGGSCAMPELMREPTREPRAPMMHSPSVERRAWYERSLVQLTLVRFREFMREPEAVFWTFAFPIILALGLGIAFRNKPADVVIVGVVRGTPAADSLARRLASASGLKVRAMSDDSAARALRTGEVALVAV